MAHTNSKKIKVVTLNCWGLYGPISKFRSQRIKAIGEELSRGEFDIVLLQEIWIKKDYASLCEVMVRSHPHTHYFHSGMFGSGLCIFSKFPVLETFQHTYSLCGFAHKVMHGDWFGGKVVGLAKLEVGNFKLNVYVTHTHAGYGHGADYKVHKTVQAYELGQFIRLTSDGCDGVVVGGDFNANSQELCFKLPLTNGNLMDAWVTQRAKYNEEDGMTAGYKVWPFKENGEVQDPVKGHRIDYLLYRPNTGIDIVCERCYTTLKQVPDQPYFYSDHIGVAAEFTVKRSVTAMAPTIHEDQQELLEQATQIIETGLTQAKADRIFYAVVFIICLLAVGFSSSLSLPYHLDLLTGVLQTCLILGLGFCAWMGLIAYSREVNVLLSVKQDMCHMQRHGNTNLGRR